MNGCLVQYYLFFLIQGYGIPVQSPHALGDLSRPRPPARGSVAHTQLVQYWGLTQHQRKGPCWTVAHTTLASVLLVLLLRLPFCGSQVGPHLCVHEGPNEDKQGAQPVPQSERVLEVQDGEDEAHELAQSHEECDSEGGALRSEDEDAPDAHVPGGWG